MLQMTLKKLDQPYRQRKAKFR